MKIELTKEEAGLIVQLCNGGIKGIGLEQGRPAVEAMLNLAEKVQSAHEAADSLAKAKAEKSPKQIANPKS